jgi:hypothetical protein
MGAVGFKDNFFFFFRCKQASQSSALVVQPVAGKG